EADGLEAERAGRRARDGRHPRGRDERALELLRVPVRERGDGGERLGEADVGVEADLEPLLGADQQAGVGGVRPRLGAVEPAVRGGVHQHRHGLPPRRGVVAVGEGEVDGERLAVAVRVAAEVADVGDEGEDEAEHDQPGPDVVEHGGAGCEKGGYDPRDGGRVPPSLLASALPLLTARYEMISSIRPRAVPRPSMPRSCAARSDTSRTRSPENGPRSLTRTTTLRPLSRLVTRRRVPRGSVRWAAV